MSRTDDLQSLLTEYGQLAIELVTGRGAPTAFSGQNANAFGHIGARQIFGISDVESAGDIRAQKGQVFLSGQATDLRQGGLVRKCSVNGFLMR